MRAHVIVDGVVENTIEVDSLDFKEGLVDASLGGCIGDQYVNGEFITPATRPSRESILARLEEIDRKTPRAVREALQSGDNSRVIALEAQATTLRAELAKA